MEIAATDVEMARTRLENGGPKTLTDRAALVDAASWTAGWVAVVIATLLLLARAASWFLQRSLSQTIRTPTALCTIAAGMALILWHRGGPSRTGRVLSLGVAVVSALTLAHFTVTGSRGYHDILYGPGSGLHADSPDQLSLPSSLILACVGVSLCGLHAGDGFRVQGPALLGCFLSLVAIIGHLYHADELFAPIPHRGIAMAPSLLLMELALGVLMAEARSGLMALLTVEDPGGHTARRLLAPAILIPPILGSLSLIGLHAGMYDPALAMSLVAVSSIVIFSGLVLWQSATLSRMHVQLEEVQDRLVLAHRIDAASYVAGWTCHEFNNLLTVIQGYADLIRDHPDSPDLCAYIEALLAATDECAEITRKLLRFTSHERASPELTDLSQLIAGLRPTIEVLVGQHVRVSISCEPDTWVRAGPKQLQHMVLQPVLNARDAMPAGGQLTIRVRRADGVVRLEVADTGTGMEPAVLTRALEPFFTTKDRMRGTGLGLATVLGSVNQLGGTIRIESEPGRGTTVTIELLRTAPVTPV